MRRFYHMVFCRFAFLPTPGVRALRRAWWLSKEWHWMGSVLCHPPLPAPASRRCIGRFPGPLKAWQISGATPRWMVLTPGSPGADYDPDLVKSLVQLANWQRHALRAAPFFSGGLGDGGVQDDDIVRKGSVWKNRASPNNRHAAI
ncbi:hypothetical protein BGW36DRAFT_432700 [Talaromyces proteolyticus]|uniref:Uncharacterized protein n=1 Tax=Talaromyces proteolyticus TaxID=1131652 RepID=A0AAD4KG72_9EURO|nr:uncharacterized protein BGW36DRAFT_432700 [Talaromyces proteolyticus]KAH8690926.1 hypothetical protein BGW36DRAFT_432700 [Talaromyces proteolyticus]